MSKSAPLNMTEREHIINMIVTNSKQKKQYTDAVSKRNQLVQVIADVVLGEHKTNYESLPKNWTQSTQQIFVEHVPSSNNDKRTVNLQSVTSVLMPQTYVNFDSLPKGLGKTLVMRVENVETANEEFKTFNRVVNSVLSSCNTSKQLVEVLPEAQKYFPPSLIAKTEEKLLPALGQDVVDYIKSNMLKAA